MRTRLNALEKFELVKEFIDNPYATYASFAKDHNIARNSLYNWVKQYEKGGIDALTPRKPSSQSIDTKASKDAEAAKAYKEALEKEKLENLKLRIENERLKKNYMVKLSETGEKVFIRLKEKNSKL